MRHVAEGGGPPTGEFAAQLLALVQHGILENCHAVGVNSLPVEDPLDGLHVELEPLRQLAQHGISLLAIIIETVWFSIQFQRNFSLALGQCSNLG